MPAPLQAADMGQGGTRGLGQVLMISVQVSKRKSQNLTLPKKNVILCYYLLTTSSLQEAWEKESQG